MESRNNVTATPSAYYDASIGSFAESSPASIVGHVAEFSQHSIEPTQRDAWFSEVPLLKAALAGLPGHLFLEYVVPRLGSRIDAVVIAGPAVLVLEFKVGEQEYRRADINQVWDYALDLKNFHEASHSAPIVPILVATEAPTTDANLTKPFADGVYAPLRTNAGGLRRLIEQAAKQLQGEPIDAKAWGRAQYRPTPTIIQAAQALYSQHSVDAISRNDAGAQNLARTSRSIEDLIDHARANSRKAIAFVTGVPGAGKTLVGLDVATRRRDESKPWHAVFLSGNGPLVAVLREALIRDEVRRLAAGGERPRKGDVGQKVKAFIQNVHHFRDDGVRSAEAPSDHVVIFDEAQRAWNRAMTADFMARKKKQPGFSQSEPEFLISVMDRHRDWAVVVCLVGGGQEINRGEAGIGAWLDAVSAEFRDWDVHVSPELTDSEYAAGGALDRLAGRPNVTRDATLHLAVSMRSFRAENVSHFVKAVLDREVATASSTLREVLAQYPIALTRRLDLAKEWVRTHARGTERYGLVASSSGSRLKPFAIDIRVGVDPVHWFLDEPDDTRSSFYLEDAATEFQVQGLELDWVCVSWDADLRAGSKGWSHHAFRGDRWTDVHKPDRRQYLLNAYRVLLTRARQGMVVFVPEGDTRDHTRKAEWYDSTFEYLAGIGLPVLA
jgi:hypothetical protein